MNLNLNNWACQWLPLALAEAATGYYSSKILSLAAGLSPVTGTKVHCCRAPVL